MHSAALQLAPVLAEKSKVPFYVAGGVLVLWALTVSAGLGLRRARLGIGEHLFKLLLASLDVCIGRRGARHHRQGGSALDRGHQGHGHQRRVTLVSRFRSSHTFAVTSDANFGIEGTLASI